MQQYVDGYMMKYQKGCCKCICVIFEGVFSHSIYMRQRGLVVKWILWYQWKVTTVVSQHLHIYILCTLSMQHCETHIVQCFPLQICSGVFVCIYVWLCVSGVEHWLLLPGRGGLPSRGKRGGGGSRAESQRFRRADVPHSSNSQSQGHRRDSHTVDEGWLSSGCNPTLHCAPHSTIHSMIPSFRVSVCMCVCFLDF